MNSFDLIGFVAVLAVLLWSGRRRAQSATEFLVADRAVPLLPLVATLVMTEFNTSTLLAFSAAGYGAGPMALALPMVFLIGLLFYTVTVAREWKRFNQLSVAQLFSQRYAPSMGYFASTLLLIAMVGFSATYVKSLALIFVPLVPSLSAWTMSGVLSLVVLLAILAGGLPSIVRADLLGFGLTVLLLPGLAIIGFSQMPDGALARVFDASQLTVNPVAQWTHPALPFRFVTTLIVLTCFTYIAAPWYGQKIFAARDEATARRAVAMAAVLVFVLYGAAVGGAAIYRATQSPLADAQSVVPSMIAHWLPSGARGIGFATLFLAAMTTLAGVWSAMAAMIAADFGAARTLGAQRLLIVAIAVLCWIGANVLGDNILNRLILANIPVAALAFALLAGFHWPRANAAGAWASAAVGVVWGIGCYVKLGDAGGYTWPWAMYGVPLIFVTGVVVSLATPAPSQAPTPTPHPN